MKTTAKKRTATISLPGRFPEMIEEIKNKDRHFSLSNEMQKIISEVHAKYYPNENHN